jgi:hypothetical protein
LHNYSDESGWSEGGFFYNGHTPLLLHQPVFGLSLAGTEADRESWLPMIVLPITGVVVFIGFIGFTVFWGRWVGRRPGMIKRSKSLVGVLAITSLLVCSTAQAQRTATAVVEVKEGGWLGKITITDPGEGYPRGVQRQEERPEARQGVGFVHRSPWQDASLEASEGTNRLTKHAQATRCRKNDGLTLANLPAGDTPRVSLRSPVRYVVNLVMWC